MKISFFIITFFLFWGPAMWCQDRSLEMHYEKSAESWEETLPLGNGRLGMTPDSGVEVENIVLNDITLWSGGPQDANNYGAHSHLPEIRNLLASGKNDLAETLVNEHFVCSGAGSGEGNGANVPFGCYQTMGNLKLTFDYGGQKSVTAENYHRRLKLDEALAECTYTVNGMGYSRTYFTSFDDDVSVVSIKSDRPGKLNFKVELNRLERATIHTQNKELVMMGQLNNGTDGKGMEYEVRVGAVLKGGRLIEGEKNLEIVDGTEVVLYISAGTDFKDRDFRKGLQKILSTAMGKSLEAQQKNHVANFQKLFNRVSLTLGNTSRSDLPMDKRLEEFGKNPQMDTDLATVFFQFGRYLSISSTRVGLLPPNLQGLWAKSIQTPWNGDYHLDVNVQMNHWPLETVNLSELNLPLKDFVGGLVEPGSRTAKAYYGADGWIAHVITNIWGYTAPGESASWGISNAGSGWVCNNLWQHYAFTQDEGYLEDIYPILRGSAEFYLSMLVEDPTTGWWVTAPSVSPENSFYLPNGKQAHVCMGPTIDNQIVRELFGNVIYASKELKMDTEFARELQQKLELLPPAGVIGEDGRIMEWLRPYKEVDPHHRHLSHLYGLYPANLITPETTPDLALAAEKSLEARGDDGPSWSIAYKILFWARLKKGDRAFKLLTNILRPTLQTHINYGAGGGVYPNLLSAGPPFQIDGNFGATAGIGEMLVQSHGDFVELLPALPEAWKVSGTVRGLKARGGFTVDMTWENGRITSYSIRSKTSQKLHLKVNGKPMDVYSEVLE